MADQAINALSTKTAPETSDQLLLVGAGEPQLIDYDKLADAILNKITSKNYALDAGQMTLLAALNKLNSDRNFFINSQSNTYDNFEAVFNKCLELSIIGVEKVFCANIKSLESYCIVKFYKRSDDSAKMIVFRYDGITIVDGATNSLLIKSIVAE